MRKIILIGYINIFKRKTGFCFPVFKEKENILIQEGNQLIEISSYLLSQPYFYKLKKTQQKSFNFNPKRECYNLFVFEDGGNYLLYKADQTYKLQRLFQSGFLTNSEKLELSDFFTKKEISDYYSEIVKLIKKVSKFNLNVGQIEDKCFAWGMKYSLPFNIELFKLLKGEVNEFVSGLIEHGKNKEAFLLLTLFRFETLSKSEIAELRISGWQNFNYNDNKIHFAVFLFALKNKMDQVILDYCKMYILTKPNIEKNVLFDIIRYFELQMDKNDQNILLYINRFYLKLSYWIEIIAHSEANFHKPSKSIFNKIKDKLDILRRKNNSELIILTNHVDNKDFNWYWVAYKEISSTKKEMRKEL